MHGTQDFRKRCRVLAALSALGLWAAGCQTSSLPLTFSPIETPPTATAWTLPIIDAHMHINYDSSAEKLVSLMDAAGVRQMVLMARYYRGDGRSSDEEALAMARRFPGRFIPFVGGQRPELARADAWTTPDNAASSTLLAQADQKLRSGEFFGLGEFIIRHYGYTTRTTLEGEVHLPVDTWLMGKLATLAARYRVPLLIHMEGEPDATPGMVSLLKSHPKANIIWAHSCGRSSARVIRQVLADHPNLFCDLGGMTNTGGYGSGWPRRGPWTFLIEDGSGNLLPDMKALHEDYPTRFLIGTDVAHTDRLVDYRRRIGRFRELLNQLTPTTARRLAYENAEALLIRNR